MSKVKKLMAALMIGALAVTSVGCNLIEKTPEAIRRQVVAKGKGIKITRGKLDDDSRTKNIMQQLEMAYGANYMENEEAAKTLIAYKQQILSYIIQSEIITSKANEVGVKLTDSEISEEVNKKYAEDVEAAGGEEEFNKRLEKSGLTEEKLKETYKKGIIENKIYEKVTQDVTVSEEKIKEYYDSNKEKYTEEPNEVKISYMLVDTEEKANEIISRIENGEAFSAIAKEVSLDESTKENGGDLGYITYDNPKLGYQIMTSAKVLKVGEVKSIQDTRGYNIIKIEDKKDFPIKEFDAVKDEIKEMLENQEKYNVFNTKLNEWEEEADVKIYSEKLI
ncbi:peptidylprolyl isomerase [Oceanirhabdus sp. W0125-5]|uniref:peptidylprolyl isomerase n=1 Tax=Oceanirhabdus sp. W0125-5 TaxID=2999116 RepID=UPI0022F32942|nr:peptidylprolyl isomerase [Oceanirhabdus sp. W0125-5]WBW97931.1 peptidylprolyl isomerase [Oceanirhabdus sp. W0125-5]